MKALAKALKKVLAKEETIEYELMSKMENYIGMSNDNWGSKFEDDGFIYADSDGKMLSFDHQDADIEMVVEFKDFSQTEDIDGKIEWMAFSPKGLNDWNTADKTDRRHFAD